MIRSNNEDKAPKRRQNILHSFSKVITKIPNLNNEYNERVPYFGRILLNSTLNDSTKIAVLKKFDPIKAEKLQKLINTSNQVLDFGDKVNEIHKDLTEKIPESKKVYAEFKNTPLGGKCKKNDVIKKNKTKKQRNKTKKQRNKTKNIRKAFRNKKNKYTRYEKTKN